MTVQADCQMDLTGKQQAIIISGIFLGYGLDEKMDLSIVPYSPMRLMAVALVLTATYTDLRWRKIPNCLTLPAIALGFFLNFVGSSWNGLIYAFWGCALGMGLLMLPYLLGGMGGGDLKLMGALGALLGSYAILNVFLYTSLAGGVMALAIAIANRSLIEMFKRMWLFLKCVFLFRAPSTGAAVFQKSPRMPYGLAIGAGTLLYMLAGNIV
jgi:prepilin peptidase CpaA